MGVLAQRTARRRKLGSELKSLREAADISVERAAQRIHGDNSKMSRLEKGRQRITRLELEALLELYGVEDTRLREGLTALSTEARRRSWWRQYGDILHPGFQEALSMESDAEQICTFEPQLISGLLQTKAYATAVISQISPWLDEDELASHVSVRLARQEIFEKERPPHYVCIMAEAALRQEVGGRKVMAEQLRHIHDMSKPPRRTIQVLPYSQGAHVGLMGAFIMYSYPDPMDLDVVNVEYLDGSLCLEEDAPVKRYRMAFDQLRSSALSTRQSMNLISDIARDLDS
ncbi:helix-turn-helix domain-containing protein [Streptomyces sp. NBC_01186]|uniref:helix-turn-helix domain-containing protein n=1 Tax=Streptomyces sp. NBC_01186 TaxID=2903765 RepID=UPI002E0FBF88|nr:helix-turn-helix domain-containing protein [Streptomyces sp. NBC_01186]